MALNKKINYKLDMLKLNNIFFYFIFSQSLFLLIYFYQTPLISDAINTNKAVLLHIIGIFWTIIGYFTVGFAKALRGQQVKPIEDKRYSFRNIFYICSYLLIIIGTTEAILQVISFVPFMEYMSKLFSSDFETEIRVAYMLPADEGGLPGIVKMFAFAPLSIYLMSFGLLNFLNLDTDDKRKLKRLNKIALLGTAIKVFFSLDHLTIMAVLLANLFAGVQKDYKKIFKLFIIIVLTFFLANLLSSKRLEGFGFVNLVLLYFKVGIVNFQLMIDTCTEHTYGFSTILAPLYLILKFFHLPSPDFAADNLWVWNPVQYYTSYAFQDFGYFYFITFYIVGMILYSIDISARRHNIYSSATYFIVMYGIISFVVIPAIRGIDFWFALLLPLVLMNRFTHVINPRVSYSIRPI